MTWRLNVGGGQRRRAGSADTRARLDSRSLPRGRADGNATEYAAAGSVVLTGRGTAAFSFVLSSPGGISRRARVVVADGDGVTAGRVVDEGPGVDARTLWLADPTALTWRHDGERRTAPIA